MKVLPANPASASSDWSDIAEVQRRLTQTCDELGQMAADVGLARHVLEYDSDRRKRALSRAMVAALAGGASAVKAEAEARASDGYQAEMMQLAKEHTAAEQQVAEWDAAKLKWETCRSLLSMLREQVKM